jgi:hypothetical protein
MENQNSISQKRNSRIEILKLISIILIILSHSVPYGTVNEYVGKINLNLATTDIKNLILVMMKYGGQIGNAVFIICSSWFLIDNTKIKVKKIFNIIADAIILSISIWILFLIFGNYCISIKETIKIFFPITFKNNWFVTCYCLFYIIHPALNLIINKLSQKQLLSINVILIFYLTINTFMQELLYYNDLIGFIAIYFLISYFKKYMSRFVRNIRLNKIILATSIVLILLCIVLINYIGLKINLLNNLLMRFCIFINPLVIISAISLFNITISKEKYYSDIINYLSSLSLLIYMIHDNYLIREYLRSSYFTFIYNTFGYQNLILYCIFLAIVTIIFSILSSIIYKNILQKIVHNISDKVYSILKKIGNKLVEKGVV